tara:strand:+ start:8714 stop:9994 length:1281 start_codon:yes stop_codon:yes gene_type:complete
MKDIIFHVGAGKTGTSAIQSGFARYGNELATKFSIHYPDSNDNIKAASGKITSGNSSELLQFLVPKRRSAAFDEKKFINDFLLTSKNANFEKIVFSNELLEEGEEVKWSALVKLIESNNMNVKIIYYVRHISDHASSVYGQMIKRSGYAKSFEEYSEVYFAKFRTSLAKFLNLISKNKITVKVYDEVKENIFSDVISTIDPQVIFPINIEKVNRSLSQQELMILKHINMHTKTPKLSTKLSDFIIYNRDVVREPFTITQDALKNITNNNNKTVDWINDTFFDGSSRLKLLSQDIEVKNIESSKKVESLVDLFASLLSFVDSNPKQIASFKNKNSKDNLDEQLDIARANNVFLKAELAEEKKHLKDAVKKYIDFSNLCPKDPTPHYRLAKLYLEQNDIENSFISINKAIALSNDETFLKFKDSLLKH